MSYDYEELNYIRFLCYLSSAPGMWTHYSGTVEVSALNTASESEIFEKAVAKLARSSFPDRPSLSSWVLERIERV